MNSAPQRPQFVKNKITFKGAVMLLANLTSRGGSQRFLLELEQGAWPREDELKQLFKDMYSTPTADPEIDVNIYTDEAVVVVTQ